MTSLYENIPIENLGIPYSQAGQMNCAAGETGIATHLSVVIRN